MQEGIRRKRVCTISNGHGGQADSVLWVHTSSIQQENQEHTCHKGCQYQKPD